MEVGMGKKYRRAAESAQRLLAAITTAQWHLERFPISLPTLKPYTSPPAPDYTLTSQTSLHNHGPLR